MTTYLVASSVSGVCVCAAMQPADTVLTRVYNRESHFPAKEKPRMPSIRCLGGVDEG